MLIDQGDAVLTDRVLLGFHADYVAELFAVFLRETNGSGLKKIKLIETKREIWKVNWVVSSAYSVVISTHVCGLIILV